MSDKDIILNELNTLIKTEFETFSRYCLIPARNQPEETKTYEYGKYKEKIRRLIYARNYILFFSALQTEYLELL